VSVINDKLSAVYAGAVGHRKNMNQKAAKTLLTVKNDILIFISVLAVVFSLAQQSSADFDDLGAGARAIGLGGAYCAIADDPFGFYYNPAGPRASSEPTTASCGWG